jgi:hypothetical protein
MRIFLFAVIASALIVSPASAYQLACSDPTREQVFARTSIEIPNGDEPAFAESMRGFRGVTDMSFAETSGREGDCSFLGRTIFYQSPQVSVLIQIETQPGSEVAEITVERTCITDDLEDWQPYGDAFQQFLDRRG